jgi:hypothetical protein
MSETHFTDDEARLRYAANGGNWADVHDQRGFEEKPYAFLWLTIAALGVGFAIGAASRSSTLLWRDTP